MGPDDLLAEFSIYLEHERAAAQATVAGYRYPVRGFLRHLGERRLEPADASARDISDYLGAQAARGLKPASVFSIGMAIRCFYRFLLAKGYAPSDPSQAVGLPKFRSRVPDPLTEEQVAAMLSCPGGRYVQVRDAAILELLYCGLRIGEALGLEDAKADFDQRRELVRRFVKKVVVRPDRTAQMTWDLPAVVNFFDGQEVPGETLDLRVLRLNGCGGWI